MSSRITTTLLLLAAAMGSVTSLSFAAALPDGDYYYSNLCRAPQGIIGHGIYLQHRARGGDSSYVWVSSVWGLEKVTEVGGITLVGEDGLTFIPYQNKEDDYEFNGEISPEKLEGIFSEIGRPEVVPRVEYLDDMPNPPPCDPATAPPAW